jgi:hypothetical protein
MAHAARKSAAYSAYNSERAANPDGLDELDPNRLGNGYCYTFVNMSLREAHLLRLHHRAQMPVASMRPLLLNQVKQLHLGAPLSTQVRASVTVTIDIHVITCVPHVLTAHTWLADIYRNFDTGRRTLKSPDELHCV